MRKELIKHEDILWRMMTSRGSFRWIDLLEKATALYNSRQHTSLHGLSPEIAHRPESEEMLRSLFLADYKKHKKRFIHQKPRFLPGDTVRIRKQRGTFFRGYEPGWEPQLHVVEAVKKTYPLTYKLAGKQKFYYASEKTCARETEEPGEQLYFIAQTRVVKRKRLRSGREVGGQREYLLKSRNPQGEKTSSWITEREFQTLQKNGYI